jgi:hypothetical protein
MNIEFKEWPIFMPQFYTAANAVELQAEIQNCMQLTGELLCD